MGILKRLNSLWVGNRLGYLERLCLTSAVAVGHPVSLYSYEPDLLVGVPHGVELKDAAEVMPRERLVSYAESGSVALGSNFWRYAMLSKGLGYWIDMDVYFLRPLDFDQDYVFGWEDGLLINSAVLFAPAHSQMVKDLLEIPGPNRRPPWYGPRRSLLFYWDRFRKGHIGVEDMPWGTYGPCLVTHAAKKNDVAKHAQPSSVFYPIHYTDAPLFYGPAEIVESMIPEEARAVHLWHARLVGLCDRPPPANSYIDLACRKHGIDTSE